MYPCYLRLFHQLIVQAYLFCAQIWHITVSDWGWQEVHSFYSVDLAEVKLVALTKCHHSPAAWSVTERYSLFVLGVVKQKASLLWKHNFRLKQLLKFSLGGNRIENWFRTVHEFQNSTVRMFKGGVYLLRNFISWSSVLYKLPKLHLLQSRWLVNCI